MIRNQRILKPPRFRSSIFTLHGEEYSSCSNFDHYAIKAPFNAPNFPLLCENSRHIIIAAAASPCLLSAAFPKRCNASNTRCNNAQGYFHSPREAMGNEMGDSSCEKVESVERTRGTAPGDNVPSSLREKLAERGWYWEERAEGVVDGEKTRR